MYFWGDFGVFDVFWGGFDVFRGVFGVFWGVFGVFCADFIISPLPRELLRALTALTRALGQALLGVSGALRPLLEGPPDPRGGH